MTIDFQADDSPTAVAYIPYCNCERDDGTYSSTCKECHGTGEFPQKIPMFHANIANSAAYGYTQFMTEDGGYDYAGYVKPERVSKVLNTLMGRKTHLDLCKTPDERLDRLINIFAWAEANNKGVSWG